jgi:glycosyltransferase involved in cell wall biosynthesis
VHADKVTGEPVPSIDSSTFIISTNGFADSPAQALRDYLVRKRAERLTVVAHPLGRADRSRHVVTTYEGGRLVDEKRIALPSRPPLTFPLDLGVPLRLPHCDAWFGFNNLACVRGLVMRRARRVSTVIYWAVDFVPDRFGPGVLTRVYDRVDRLASRSADARIELSEAALEGRNRRLGLSARDAAQTLVAPMGAWLDRVPGVSPNAWERRRVVYLGHLVERQGVSTLLDALALLPGVTADVVGSGPLERELRSRAAALGIADRVVFHGYVEDHRDVEAILAAGTVAAAPYVVRDDNFTRFADPGKLKAYLAAGLPIVLTGVPPNAAEIVDAGAGKLVVDSPEGVAAGIEALLDSEETWGAASRAARRLAGGYDWNAILSRTLARLGFD